MSHTADWYFVDMYGIDVWNIFGETISLNLLLHKEKYPEKDK